MPSIPSREPAISCFDDLDFFTDFENKFPAIIYNDAQTSKLDFLTEPILNPQHIDEFDLNNKTSLPEYAEEEQNVLYFNDLFPFNIIRPNNLKSKKDNDDNMAFPPCEQRHRFLRYEGLEYPDTDIVDFEGRLARIHKREVHRVSVFDFGGLSYLMAEGLSGRMLMEHRDKAGVSVFTSRDWRRMFDIKGPLTAGFGVYWAKSARQIPNKGGLRDYWMGISSTRDFLGTAPSYTLIRDLILRLCHWLIAYSIAGRSQAHEKVTVTDLFYLRGMDVGSVNVPYLLARYLRLFADGRKSEAHIFGGQFVARLAEQFRLLAAEILGELTVITPKLLVIDMAEHPVATVGAPAVTEDAPIIDEGGQANPAPEQAPQLEEDVHEICRGLTEQREVIDAMAHDFSRFSTWVTTGLGRMKDRAGVAYTPYAQTHPGRPREGNIDKYWWRIYESGNLEVLES
ncbi:hypothetical protein Tco_0467707 [Tanacetum coccineum]